MSSVSIPVVADSEIESDEQFDLMLNIPSSLMGITAGSNTEATGIIIDSTGKLVCNNLTFVYVYYHFCMQLR